MLKTNNIQKGFKAQIKEQITKFAAIKANKRRLLRKEQRELIIINEAFGELIWAFQTNLWTHDWDNLPTDVDIFAMYDVAWKKWCETYNSNKLHMLHADENAFNDFALNNNKTNKNDRPVFITGDKLTNLRWAL